MKKKKQARRSQVNWTKVLVEAIKALRIIFAVVVMHALWR